MNQSIYSRIKRLEQRARATGKYTLLMFKSADGNYYVEYRGKKIKEGSDDFRRLEQSERINIIKFVDDMGIES